MFGFKRKAKKRKEEKVNKHNKILLQQYEEGRILQVDNQTDNKEYFKGLDNKDEVIEEVQEEIASAEVPSEDGKEEVKETNPEDLPSIEPLKIDPEDKLEEDKNDS